MNILLPEVVVAAVQNGTYESAGVLLIDRLQLLKILHRYAIKPSLDIILRDHLFAVRITPEEAGTEALEGIVCLVQCFAFGQGSNEAVTDSVTYVQFYFYMPRPTQLRISSPPYRHLPMWLLVGRISTCQVQSKRLK